MNNTVFIVTGAAGHLGSHVARELLLQGKQVRALVLPNETCPDFIDVNRYLLKEYTGNVCELSTLDCIFKDGAPEEIIVIHCAGIVSITKKEDRRVYDVNVNGTANIIGMCKKYRVKRLVYISSVHAIPTLPRGQTIREVDSFNPDAVHGYYDKTKAIATQLVLDAAGSGLDAVVVHPSGIIGPHGLPTGNMAQLITLYVRGKLPAAIHGGFDFVDVRDVASGALAAAEKGRSGECYILSNRFIDLKEMFDILSQANETASSASDASVNNNKKPLKKLKIYLPMWVAKAVAPFAELHYRAAHKTPLFTRYSLKTLSENGVFSHDKASKKLNYRTRPLRETLTDTALWVQASMSRKRASSRA